MGKNEVIDIVRKYKEMVLSTIGPASVYLYGSYSKGSAREDSDIDVAVVVPEVKRRPPPRAAVLPTISLLEIVNVPPLFQQRPPP